MHTTLHERQWRVFLATEALKAGVGGISRVSRLSGADRKTVRKGVVELHHPPLRAESAEWEEDERNSRRLTGPLWKILKRSWSPRVTLCR